MSKRKKRSRSKQGERVSYLIGRRELEEAARQSIAVKKIFVSDAAYNNKQVANVLQSFSPHVKIDVVETNVLDKISPHSAHQGIVAELEPYEYASLNDVLANVRNKEHALFVVLDHITDEGNFGAIVRSAEVVGASAVIIPDRRSASVGAGAYKTSAGALLHMPVVRVTNIANTIEELKQEQFWVAGASEHAHESVWESPFEGRIALVMGSEDEGLSKLVQDRCDFLVKLTQKGNISSLNVAQAASVLMYEWLRRQETS